MILRGEQEEERESSISPRSAFVSGFTMIFLSEWGDKTQIASALFAAEYEPIMVFIGVMTALLILSAMAIYLGKLLSSRIDRKQVTRIAGVVFLLIGLSFMLSAVMSPAFADMF